MKGVILAAGATTICITNHPGSPVTEVADIKLYTAAEETTPVGDPLSARAAQLAVIDILYEGFILHTYYIRTIRRIRIWLASLTWFFNHICSPRVSQCPDERRQR
jgi:DNA-binding MurR/RpiR family transcriptional regulator